MVGRALSVWQASRHDDVLLLDRATLSVLHTSRHLMPSRSDGGEELLREMSDSVVSAR
jgi:hypothetical protein